MAIVTVGIDRLAIQGVDEVGKTVLMGRLLLCLIRM